MPVGNAIRLSHPPSFVGRRSQGGRANGRGTAGFLLGAALLTLSGATPAFAFTSHRLGFQVKVKSEISPYSVLGVYALPGEALPIEVVRGPSSRQSYRLEVDGMSVEAVAPGVWLWATPTEKGLYPLSVVDGGSQERMTLNVFVLTPYEEVDGEKLGRYRIGPYPDEPFRGLSAYLPPAGFIEVTPGNLGVPVSPHFNLGQFACKQAGGFPKYVALEEGLLLKLELLLERLNAKGHPAETFHVMSGYRTPYYNRAIGNVRYSRHIYGDAADIFVDESPRDGMMDDLNRDGLIDSKDAEILRSAVEEIHGQPWYEPLIGGLGRYGPEPHRGPFVHIDTRGFRARW